MVYQTMANGCTVQTVERPSTRRGIVTVAGQIMVGWDFECQTGSDPYPGTAERMGMVDHACADDCTIQIVALWTDDGGLGHCRSNFFLGFFGTTSRIRIQG